MKPNLFLTLACLCCLAGFALAQTADQPATPIDDVKLTQEEAGKAIMKSFFRPFWNDQGINPMLFEVFGDPAVRAAWGISDEQHQQSADYMFNLASSEEAKEIGIRVQKIEDKTSISVVAEDIQSEGWETDVEAIKKLQAIAERSGAFIMNAAIEALDNTLTPEQWQRVRESQLANMDELPLISPDMFEALDLTAAQRQEMEQIKTELEPEFEAVLDEFVNGIIAPQNKSEDDPTLNKKRQEEVMSKGKAFSTKFKTQMFDVLTDEQWLRLQHLIDNPPEHAKIFRAKLKEQNGESEEQEKTKQAAEKPEKEVWTPGPNSWKPGDAIPESYRQQRNERRKFPGTE